VLPLANRNDKQMVNVTPFFNALIQKRRYKQQENSRANGDKDHRSWLWPSHSSLLSRVSQRQRTLVGFLMAGLLFYGVFWLAYQQIDENLYVNRDDAIITVSHGRNFVEYGSIGVNPSGERVEGYSSPLQFLIFSGTYALTHLHYDLYFRIIAGLSAFIM
jgi:hypothetical protein